MGVSFIYDLKHQLFTNLLSKFNWWLLYYFIDCFKKIIVYQNMNKVSNKILIWKTKTNFQDLRSYRMLNYYMATIAQSPVLILTRWIFNVQSLFGRRFLSTLCFEYEKESYGTNCSGHCKNVNVNIEPSVIWIIKWKASSDWLNKFKYGKCWSTVVFVQSANHRINLSIITSVAKTN